MKTKITCDHNSRSNFYAKNILTRKTVPYYQKIRIFEIVAVNFDMGIDKCLIVGELGKDPVFLGGHIFCTG